MFHAIIIACIVALKILSKYVISLLLLLLLLLLVVDAMHLRSPGPYPATTSPWVT